MSILNHQVLLLIISTLSAAIGAITILFWVMTPILKIVFSIVFFSTVFILLLTLFDFGSNKKITIVNPIKRIGGSFIPFVIASIGTIIIFTSQFDAPITGNTLLETFTSLPTLGIVRVFFGLFLVCVFPGYMLVINLANSSEFNCLEKLGLSLALSFIISNVIGLLLLTLKIELTVYSIICSIWVFGLFFALIRMRKSSSTVPIFSLFGSQLLQYVLVICVGLSLVFSFYVTSLNTVPYSGVLVSDIPDYMNDLNQFLSSNVGHRIPYPPWVAFHAWILHYVINLPPLYSYVALQFYVLLVPISIYFLCKTLFPSQGKSAAIASALISVTSGLGSLGILLQGASSYLTNPILVLSILGEKMGLKSFVTFHINGYTILHASTFNGIFSILGIAFAYRYLTKNKLPDLLFCSVLMTTALFCQNIVFFLSSITVVTFIALLKHHYGALLRFYAVIFVFAGFFDLITKNYFQNYIMANYLTMFVGPYKFFFSLQSLVPAFLISLMFIVFSAVIIKLRKRIKIRIKIPIIISYRKFIPFFPWLLLGVAIGLIISAIILWKINYDWFTFKSTSDPYPWYFQIIYYGIIFLLAVSTFATYVRKIPRTPLLFVSSWIISILLTMSLSLFLPEVFGVDVWVLRLCLFMTYPLVFLAAVGLVEVFRIIRLRKRGRIICASILLLVAILVPSFLSYSYDTELWYNSGNKQPLKTDDALQWMYSNLPLNACIFTLSDNSYQDINNLVSRKAIPLHSLTSWPRLILANSELPEDVLSMLNELGVTHVYITNEDAVIDQFQTLFSILPSFKLVHMTNNSEIYEVPKYPLYVDSSYTIVSYTSDNVDKNHVGAFNMLLSSGLNFSIKTDIALENLLPSNVYFFPSNQKLPNKILNELVPSISSGSQIVFMNKDFARLDEFGDSSNLSFKINDESKNCSNTAIARGVISNYASHVQFENDLAVPLISVEGPNIKLLSSFELLDGISVPFIAQQRIDNGSIIFINMPTYNSIDEEKLFMHIMNILSKVLPPPNSPDDPFIPSYPSELYDFTVPWEFNLYKLNGLHGFLLSDGETIFSGHEKFESKYIYFHKNKSNIQNLTLIYDGKAESFNNITVTNMTIAGQGYVMSHSSQASLFSAPHAFSVFTMGGYESSLHLSHSKVKLEIKIGGEVKQICADDATINIKTTDSCNYLMSEPTVWVNGTMESSIQGGLKQNDGFFYALPHSKNQFKTFNPTMFEGTFVTQFTYSSGLVLQQLLNSTCITPSFIPEVTPCWLDAKWEYRTKLSINNTLAKDDLSDLPVLIRLSDDNFDFSKVRSDGNDIRFTKGDGITLLNYQIETWNYSVGEAAIWLSIPSIKQTNSPDFIYLYYGNNEAEIVSNFENIWDKKYVIVNHFDEVGLTFANNLTVSSANIIREGQILYVNVSRTSTDGVVGHGLKLNGIDEFAVISYDQSMEPNEFTLEIWVKPLSMPSYSARVLEKDSPWENGWRIEIYSSNSLNAAFCAVDTTYGNKYLGIGPLSLNNWTYLAVVFKDGYLATYSNGELMRVDTNVTRVNYGGEYLTLGASHSFNTPFNGEFDELRISNIARSSTWIEAQYLSMNGRLVTISEKNEIFSEVIK